MHASSGQENITCGETARGPKEKKEREGGKERTKENRGCGMERNGKESEERIKYNIKEEKQDEVSRIFTVAQAGK